jgi:hypothetical protein
MQTDLSKILAVSGQPGLYQYLAQSRTGAIVESLSTKERKNFDVRSRITSLADISIYTAEGELKLKEVLLKLKEVLGKAEAPGPKAAPEEFKALFGKAVPDYDGDRFYVSHMKKIAQWYNELLKYASFDFVEEEENPDPVDE